MSEIESRDLVRRDYEAPDLSNTPPEILAYIERLEQAIVELAEMRDEHIRTIWALQNGRR